MATKIPSWDETTEIPQAPPKVNPRDQVTFLGSENLGKLMADVFPRVAKGEVEGRSYGAQVGAGLLDNASLLGRGIASSGVAPEGAKWKDGNPGLGETKGTTFTGKALRDPGTGAALLTAPFTAGASIPAIMGAGAAAGAASATAHQAENVLDGGKVNPYSAAGEVALNALLPIIARGGGKVLKAGGKKILNTILKPKEGVQEQVLKTGEKTIADLIFKHDLDSPIPFTGGVEGIQTRNNALRSKTSDAFGKILDDADRITTLTSKGSPAAAGAGRSGINVTGGVDEAPIYMAPEDAARIEGGNLLIPETTIPGPPSVVRAGMTRPPLLTDGKPGIVITPAPRVVSTPPEVVVTPNPVQMPNRIDPRFVNPAKILGKKAGLIKESVNPDDLIFRESSQNRMDAVRDLFPGDEYLPTVTIKTKRGLEILDGHNRAAVASERGHKIPTVSIGEKEYQALKNAGFDDVEISHAVLTKSKEFEAANALDQQFPGADVSEGGRNAKDALDELMPDAPRAQEYGIPSDRNLPAARHTALPPASGRQAIPIESVDPFTAEDVRLLGRAPGVPAEAPAGGFEGAPPSGRGPLRLPPGTAETVTDLTKKIDLQKAIDDAFSKLGGEFAKEGKHAGVLPGIDQGKDYWSGALARKTEDGLVPIRFSQGFKQEAGDAGNFLATDPGEVKGKARFANALYRAVRDQQNELMPDLIPLNKVLSETHPIKAGLEDAIPRLEKNNLISPTDLWSLAPAAIGGGAGIAAHNPLAASLAFAAPLTVNRLSKNPTVASQMYRLGESMVDPATVALLRKRAIERMLATGLYGDGNQ